MGSIRERRRKDGSIGYTAQIILKRKGKPTHREAQTFDRRTSAVAWLKNREAELKQPGGIERAKVKGMTVGGLEDYITKGLKGRYLLDPQVTVTIDEYRNFFVNGEVDKPGGYPYVPGLTVRKAVSLAGGFKERAVRDKVTIIRDEDSSQTPKKVDLSSPVMPGDIITVEQSFF